MLECLFIPGWHDGNTRCQCAHLSGPAAVQASFCSLNQQHDKKKYIYILIIIIIEKYKIWIQSGIYVPVNHTRLTGGMASLFAKAGFYWCMHSATGPAESAHTPRVIRVSVAVLTPGSAATVHAQPQVTWSSAESCECGGGRSRMLALWTSARLSAPHLCPSTFRHPLLPVQVFSVGKGQMDNHKSKKWRADGRGLFTLGRHSDILKHERLRPSHRCFVLSTKCGISR